jgi:hypothetical protein
MAATDEPVIKYRVCLTHNATVQLLIITTQAYVGLSFIIVVASIEVRTPA